MFIQIYFKDKNTTPPPPSETLAPSVPVVESPQFAEVAAELPMAPGFTEASAQLIKEPSFSKPKISFPKLKFNFVIPKMGLSIFVLAGLGGGLLIFLIYYFLLHQAEIILSTRKESYSSEIEFKVSRESAFVEQFSLKTSGKVEGITTGEKVTGEKSKGEITIYNGLSEKQDLSEGAIFTAKNGAQFVLDSGVVISGATNSADLDEGVVTKAFGKKTVSVTALEIGAEGNIDSG